MTNHKYVERRETPLCDFCCSAEAVFLFESDADPMCEIIPYKGNLVHLSEGGSGWGACNDCANMVEFGDPADLARFVVDRMPPLPGPRGFSIFMLTNFYTGVLPGLKPKIPAPKVEGGHVTYAAGSEEFIEDVRKWRGELNARRE